ncbi:hypothetical protein [Stieleria marina]|uniref:Transmembrane protein n=1 Tax=Stieleria marina TaxID=1930275 RepID=A0A517P3C4_9BACT|nr:hypothetical protein K239x_58830 [Planctomycetes bacterium K23_9]
MSEILLYYRRPDPTTWVYMSSFLTIGLYFVFHRFWSIRNLDIVLLILLAPGLLMVHEGRRRQLREIESEAIAARQLIPPANEAGGASPLSQHDAVDPNLDSKWRSQRNRRSESPLTSGTTLTAVVDRSPAIIRIAQAEQVKAEQVESEQVESEQVESGSDEAAGEADQVAGDGEASLAEISEDVLDQPTEEIEEAVTPSPEFYSAQTLRRNGFILLFVVQLFILIRLLMDALMVRRPLLNPNLTTGGMYFISISLFVFLMGNVVNSTPRMQVWQGPELGPGYALMHRVPAISTRPVSESLAGVEPPQAAVLDDSQQTLTMVAKVLAILAHLAIVTGIVLIGNRHFGNLASGVGAATLYLILPYTAQMTGRVDHALPAACLLWAILMYRKPMIAGVFFGLAAGLVYYPLFLLPLWCSFYWRRGVRRFVVGVLATLASLMLALSFGGTATLLDHLVLMFGLRAPMMQAEHLQGIWSLGWNPIWRLPVIVGFVILSTLFAAWPSPKNLGTLISCSAAVMVAAQFWHGFGGGLYVAWFLPLLLLTIFRPNLQDRVALKVVQPSRRELRRPQLEAGPA